MEWELIFLNSNPLLKFYNLIVLRVRKSLIIIGHSIISYWKNVYGNQNKFIINDLQIFNIYLVVWWGRSKPPKCELFNVFEMNALHERCFHWDYFKYIHPYTVAAIILANLDSSLSLIFKNLSFTILCRGFECRSCLTQNLFPFKDQSCQIVTQLGTLHLHCTY